MSAEVTKYTLEQVEALELAPGTHVDKLEGWVPELASEPEAPNVTPPCINLVLSMDPPLASVTAPVMPVIVPAL